MDAVKNGWAAPRPNRQVQAFRPTPELVHGVTVSSPHLAAALRRAGWFSGKSGPLTEVGTKVAVHRDEHGFAVGAEAVEDDAIPRTPSDRGET
jgi:hypothetical protein